MEVINKSKPVNKDPRPDINEGLDVWDNLLEESLKVDREMTYVLHGMRIMGCKVVEANSIDGLKIEPVLYSKKSLWKGKDHYKQYCDRWLVKYKDKMKELLVKKSNSIKEYSNDQYADFF